MRPQVLSCDHPGYQAEWFDRDVRIHPEHIQFMSVHETLHLQTVKPEFALDAREREKGDLIASPPVFRMVSASAGNWFNLVLGGS